MAQEVLCNRKTPTDISVSKTVAVLHDLSSSDMATLILDKGIQWGA